MASFRIHSSDNQYLVVEPLCRTHPECHDYWDGNWLDCQVEIHAGAFQGVYKACLRSDEFLVFRKGIAHLASTTAGEAEFRSMENWLSIKISGDRRGHFKAECQARDTFGSDSRLEFFLVVDQTQIPEILNGLDMILKKFPVQGQADI